MKLQRILLGCTIAAALACGAVGTARPAASPASAGREITSDTFTVDPVHSTLVFRIRHFGVSWFWGRVNLPGGSFTIDEAEPANSSIHITAEIKNVDAGNEGRDRFLKSPDFFNVREYPTAEFTSNSVRRIEDGVYEATGDFTMRAVTRQITVRLEEYTQRQTTRFGYRAGFEATFHVKRSDFGMTSHLEDDILGDEVRIIASIEGVRPQ